MRVIELAATPNQSFSVTLDGNRWDFTIKQAVYCMVCDVSLNDEVILQGQRIVADTPLIPYEHLQRSGNFVILTENEEMPFWDRFGVDQQMIYATADEVAAAQAGAYE